MVHMSHAAYVCPHARCAHHDTIRISEHTCNIPHMLTSPLIQAHMAPGICMSTCPMYRMSLIHRPISHAHTHTHTHTHGGVVFSDLNMDVHTQTESCVGAHCRQLEWVFRARKIGHKVCMCHVTRVSICLYCAVCM